ncbi:type IA DNA topoisomerase [Solibacillus isronensis]|uniref:type IA DNA topoisomerase n=1 Tax=Solibacillus isronensis TaxID=412383 RepID=UPI0009A72F79|nr:type IA DNA topoisomerase [Solibacillus isronensis]
MDLIICEKRSVGISTAEALSTSFKEEKGYIVCNNNILITWCIGHLFTMAAPKSYNPVWEKWSWHTLPMIPDRIKLEIIDDARIKAQVSVIKKLVEKPEVTRVVVNSDAAQEGQLIAGNLLRMLSVKKPIVRMWVSSMSVKALQQAYKNVISWNDPSQVNLLKSAETRTISDWIVGLSLSRAMTLWAQDAGVDYSEGGSRALNMGRIINVVAAMVYDREMERTKFSKRMYYPLLAQFQQGDTKYLGYLKAEKEYEKSVVENIINQIRSLPANVVKSEKQEKTTPAPLLFDLASAIAAASKRFGMKAPHIQEVLNDLYLKKYLSYIRTDSQYITENEIPLMHETFDLLKDRYPHLTANADKKYVHAANKRIVQPDKVADHHGILVEPKVPTGLSDEEQKIYDMVLERCFMHFNPPFKYQNTSIHTRMGDHLFVSTYNDTIELGWKALLPTNQKDKEKESAENEDDAALTGSPNVVVGSANIIGAKIEEKETAPPPAYTDGSLILAMSNVSTIVKDPVMKEKLKERGIGTSATLAATVEKLLNIGYLTYDKKKVTITKKGAFIVESLRKTKIQVLTSPEMTAQWEIELENIRKGKSPQTFNNAIVNFVKLAVEEIKSIPNDNVQLIDYIGECPKCKSGLTRTAKRINCSGTKNGCDFFLWSNQYNKAVSDKMLEQLLTKGKTNVLSFNTKEGKPYKAQLALEAPYEQGKLKLLFAEAKPKVKK